MACGSPVAAVQRQKYLEIAESAHHCLARSSFQLRIEELEGACGHSGAFVADIWSSRSTTWAKAPKYNLSRTTLEEKKRWAPP
jgi:hypothetical protein